MRSAFPNRVTIGKIAVSSIRNLEFRFVTVDLTAIDDLSYNELGAIMRKILYGEVEYQVRRQSMETLKKALLALCSGSRRARASDILKVDFGQSITAEERPNEAS